MYDFEIFEADQTMYNFYEIDKSVKLTLDTWFNFVHSDDLETAVAKVNSMKQGTSSKEILDFRIVT